MAPDSPWIMHWLYNLHHCAFSYQGYPWYAGWMETPIIGTVTVAELVIGSLGVLLVFLCISGMVIWWPMIRPLFRVRRGRGRNPDLHRLVGILAVPLLLMWAVSGASFEFDWPRQVYYRLLPGSDPAPTPPRPGTGSLISIESAQATALALQPGARAVGVSETTPAQPAGSYRFSLRDGFDPYQDTYFPGKVRVAVDSHGGGATDYPKSGGPITQQYWENWQSGLHFGSFVPRVPRLVLVLFGLVPVLLAITGASIWLATRRSRKPRRPPEHPDARAAASPTEPT